MAAYYDPDDDDDPDLDDLSDLEDELDDDDEFDSELDAEIDAEIIDSLNEEETEAPRLVASESSGSQRGYDRTPGLTEG